jgi:hypothetical protein
MTPVTIEQDIVAWAASRPRWQQAILRTLAAGAQVDQGAVEKIADELVANIEPQVAPLTITDMPGAQATRARVQLNGVQEIKNVNRLLDNGKLEFAAAGLTVIYGDNASGKSGYARLIKTVVGARHREDVHPDVFGDSVRHPQAAIVGFDSGGASSTLTWPSATSPDLRSINFYDEACGDDYLGGESELSYRPSALVMLDGLIAACDAIHAILDQRLQQNESTRVGLPAVPEGTDAAKFLTDLSGTTTKTEIDEACALGPEAAKQLAELAQEEVRLRATDPSKERARTEGLAAKVQTVADRVNTVASGLSGTKIQAAETAFAKAVELRAAASMASSTTFENEPVSGVGTDTWRTLWEAAKNYSEAEAYHEHSFPHTETGARCVLCQQELNQDATSRFGKFQAYMQNTTEQRAQTAERELNATIAVIRSLEPNSPQIAAVLVELRGSSPELADTSTAWLKSADGVKDALLARIGGKTETTAVELEAAPLKELKDLVAELTAKAEAIDASQFKTTLADVVAKKNHLEGRKALSTRRDDIKAEVKRMAARSKIENARRETDTSVITKKCTALTRSHVTSLVRDQFTRESDRLHLERVTLNDLGGHKGKLRHKPALLGAKMPKPVSQILSEGEQTALGLAGYFTESHFDGSSSAMVLDDPVTSLDHIRRSHVATRLAQFAKDRQVIVFTHDITFVGDLSKAAEAENVPFAERCIHRRGDGVPGLCVDQYPWKVRDASKRLQDLDQQLAEIKRERANLNQDEYESKCADWAGRLSETWERLISVEIVNPVVDRGTSEVRPKMFRLLARITEDDNREFQESYGRCSLWARRHDKSPEVNYVAPDPGDMEQELAAVRTWFARVKKYRN